MIALIHLHLRGHGGLSTSKQNYNIEPFKIVINYMLTIFLQPQDDQGGLVVSGMQTNENEK